PTHLLPTSSLQPSTRLAPRSVTSGCVSLHPVASLSLPCSRPKSHRLAPAARIGGSPCPNYVCFVVMTTCEVDFRIIPGHGGAACTTRGARLAHVNRARRLIGPACPRRGHLFPTSRGWRL